MMNFVVKMMDMNANEQESFGDEDDLILPGGFLTVAYQYNLGVGIRPELREEVTGVV